MFCVFKTTVEYSLEKLIFRTFQVHYYFRIVFFRMLINYVDVYIVDAKIFS